MPSGTCSRPGRPGPSRCGTLFAPVQRSRVLPPEHDVQVAQRRHQAAVSVWRTGSSPRSRCAQRGTGGTRATPPVITHIGTELGGWRGLMTAGQMAAATAGSTRPRGRGRRARVALGRWCGSVWGRGGSLRRVPQGGLGVPGARWRSARGTRGEGVPVRSPAAVAVRLRRHHRHDRVCPRSPPANG